MLTLGSLFAGIGGFELGLERTGGFKTEWQVEIDPFCQRVLAKHWPDVRRWDDVRTFPPPGEWGVDVVIGGFPCQPISHAGEQRGSEDSRWLWPQIARIVGILRPGFVLLENVSGLLGRGFDAVLGDLAALGFDAEWSIVSACSVGAPHMRRRLFVIAYANEVMGPTRVRIHESNDRQRTIPTRVHCDGQETRREWMEATTRNGGSSDGISDRVDRLEALGNAVVPQCAEWIGRRLLEAINQQERQQ